MTHKLPQIWLWWLLCSLWNFKIGKTLYSLPGNFQADSCVREGPQDKEDEADADDESPRPFGRVPPRHHGGWAGKSVLLGSWLLRADWTGGSQRHSHPHLAGQPGPPTVGGSWLACCVSKLNIDLFLSAARLSPSSVGTWSQFSGERRLEVFSWLVVSTISGRRVTWHPSSGTTLETPSYRSVRECDNIQSL